MVAGKSVLVVFGSISKPAVGNKNTNSSDKIYYNKVPIILLQLKDQIRKE